MGFDSTLIRWSPTAPTLDVETAGETTRIVIAGDWTIRTAGTVEASVADTRVALARTETVHGPVTIDLTAVGQIDTAGAMLIERLIAAVPPDDLTLAGLDDTRRVLIAEIVANDRTASEPAPARPVWRVMLEGLGAYGIGLAVEAKAVASLLGGAALVVLFALRHPSRIRFLPFVNQLERTALQAAPIIVLMSFLIGAIIAQQGAFYFRRFGADLYVVDMVGVLSLREIAVLLTAIMVAGRSGSAFTAELGSMKMREEIDALKVIGLDPVEVLVVPRIVALMVALPILTFLADLASLLGAAIVCNVYAGIPTETFMQRLKAAVEMRTFLVGIAKAPFMALIIGLVASMEGLLVKGSAESLGAQTTLSVVKSIFMVIVVDGIFAMFYAAVGV